LRPACGLPSHAPRAPIRCSCRPAHMQARPVPPHTHPPTRTRARTHVLRPACGRPSHAPHAPIRCALACTPAWGCPHHQLAHAPTLGPWAAHPRPKWDVACTHAHRASHRHARPPAGGLTSGTICTSVRAVPTALMTSSTAWRCSCRRCWASSEPGSGSGTVLPSHLRQSLVSGRWRGADLVLTSVLAGPCKDA